MIKKSKSVKPDSGSTNGVATEQVAVTPQPVKEAEATKVMEISKEEILNRLLNDLLNKHKEKGSMAFEILKNAVSQKMDSIIAGTNFKNFVNNCFTLADDFKEEMDKRWTTDFVETSDKFNGKTVVSDLVTSETPAKDAKTIN